MDNISFTGIHNLRVFKSKDINNADRCTLRVSANLSNDRNGYDLSDFVNYLKKARKEYRDFCQYSDNPTSIDIDCLTIEDNVHGRRNAFRLNKIPFLFDRDEVIPIFEFMAQFTRRAAQAAKTPAQRNIISSRINNAITEAAVKYFDAT